MISAHPRARLSFSEFNGQVRFSCKDAPGLVFNPIGVEVFTADGIRHRLDNEYHRIIEEAAGEYLAYGELGFQGVRFHFEDRWVNRADEIEIQRSVRVEGTLESAGFASSLWANVPSPKGWEGTEIFAPGMLYGRPELISPMSIGGSDSRLHCHPHVLIREDRLPLPVIAIQQPEGMSVALLHLDPDGQTTEADSLDTNLERPLIDDRFRFASLGVMNREGGLGIGVLYPGCEGDITYRGDTYPGGQISRWRLRYHPVRNGFTQSLRLSFRLTQAADFKSLVRSTWRWAWKRIRPVLQKQDLSAARASLVDMLFGQIQTTHGKTGIPLAVDAVTGQVYDHFYLMGFTGRNTDAAYLLLREAARGHGQAVEFRTKASAIIDDFVGLKMNPPVGEGFDRGEPMVFSYLGLQNILYLRSLAEGAASVLMAYRLEKDHGRSHPAWKKWSEDFGRWLLTKQRPDGSFARGYHAGSGEEANPAALSSYNAIALLELLHRETKDPAFLQAAIRCGDFVWKSGHERGEFVGGTIDNPDVADKEAATISLSAYLALYESTSDKKWLDRASLAADFGETWIYGWDIPMPVDANASALHWKQGASTVGLQLISTGHSLADQYMAFDVGSYRKISHYTGDPHYSDVADILLHNTKAMLAIPGRTFDLHAPGWQQEHWSLAPRRGVALHRLWLPWVTVSHLQGMAEDEDFLSRPKA